MFPSIFHRKDEEIEQAVYEVQFRYADMGVFILLDGETVFDDRSSEGMKEALKMRYGPGQLVSRHPRFVVC